LLRSPRAWWKRVLGVFAGVAVLLAVLVASLDFIAAWAFGRWATQVTGVAVDTQVVLVQPFAGTVRVTGLQVGKPAGFTTRAARLEELRLRVDPSTLLSDVVVVHELTLDALQVTYERAERGGTNLDAIQRSVEAHVKQGEGARDAGSPPRGRRYVIDKLAIRNARVLMTTKGLAGQGLTFPLPDVELRDVGRKKGGLEAGEVAALVTTTVQQKIALRLLSNVDALRRGGLEGAIDALKALVK
jgi:uncharacterized protein involved in outer membrane biogenesis